MKTSKIIKKAGLFLLLMTLILGLVYPLVITGVSALTMRDKANGSLIVENGEVIGSKLIAQSIYEKEYFVGRPDNGSASNIAYKSNELQEEVQARINWWHNFDETTKDRDIPDDLIYASASGVDPHISVKAARFQSERIAKARGISVEEVNHLIDEYTIKPILGVIGEQCVNVLELNLALDQ